MNPAEPGAQRAQRIAAFIAKWSPGGAAHGLNEEQGAQQHVLEFCALLGVAPPAGGDDRLFERTSGGTADVRGGRGEPGSSAAA